MEAACDRRAGDRRAGVMPVEGGNLSGMVDEVGRSAVELEVAKDGEVRDGWGAWDGLSCSALLMTVGAGRAGRPWWDIVPPLESNALAV